MRRWLVWGHRVAGLFMAGFLVVAGLTGALLAWYQEFDAALNPQLLRVEPPVPGAPMLAPLVLRERVQASYPAALASFVPLDTAPGHAAVFFLRTRPDPAGGRPTPLAQDQVFIDPYTGAVLGDRLWGAWGEGWRHVMPFVYRLHSDLALGGFGHHLFGIVALLWTLDCFVGAWLTLPARRRAAAASTGTAPPAHRSPGWWSRWAPAWRVRWRSGRYKLAFDLHRAGGLWPWVLLFVFAWSSVAFNLGEVYDPVMKALFPSQVEQVAAEPGPKTAEATMPWEQALATGRAHMQTLAQTRGFTVLNEHRLSLDPRHGQYTYRVRSDRDLRERRPATLVSFDAASGALTARYVPTGEALGDTLTSWMVTLHLADIGGWPYRLAVTLLGVAIAVLSVTGLIVWWKKRRARQTQQGRPKAARVLE